MSFLSMFTRPRPEDATGEVYWGRAPDQPGLPLHQGKIKGWAYDQRRDAPLAVQLRIDGAVVAKARGGIRREEGKHPHEAQSGFIVVVPESVRGNGPHHYEVCFAGTSVLVPNGAFVAAVDEKGDLEELDHAEGGPLHRVLLPWRRPSWEGGNLAKVKRLVADGRVDEACDRMRDLYNAQPSSWKLLDRLSRNYVTVGRYDEALAALECVLALHPSHVASLEQRIDILTASGSIDALPGALEALADVVPSARKLANGWTQYYSAKENWSEALNWSVIELRMIDDHPKDAMAVLVQVIRICERLPDFEAAARYATEAAATFSFNASFHQVKGDRLLALGRVEEAAAAYGAALEIDRKHEASHMRLGQSYGLLGRFAEAFDQLERHFTGPDFQGPQMDGLGQPVVSWTGDIEPLGVVLVWVDDRTDTCETLLQLSLVAVLTDQLGLAVTLFVPPALESLVRSAFPKVRVTTTLASALSDPTGARVSHQICLSRLARFFRRRPEDFAFQRPYLVVDKDKVQQIHDECSEAGRWRLVGLSVADCDRSGDGSDVGNANNLSLAALVEALDAPHVRFVILDSDSDPAAVERAQALATNAVIEWSAIEGDRFLRLSTLVAAMDAVVAGAGVVTALAGGLGVPGFVLASRAPAAWWLGAGGDCPWYPSITVVRRSGTQMDWQSALMRAPNWLASLSATRPADKDARLDGQLGETEANLRHLLHIALTEKNGVIAASILARLVKQRPADQELLIKQGETALSINDLETAKTVFRFVLEQQPECVGARTGLIHALIAQYDLEGAIRLLDGLAGEYDTALCRLHAALLLETGRPDAAMALCETLIKAADLGVDERLEVELLLARAECALGEQHSALSRLEGLMGPHDPDLRATFETGRIHENLGDIDGAMLAYTQAAGSATDFAAGTLLALCRQEPDYIGEPAAAKPVVIPAVHGTFPRAERQDLVLFVSCDAAYFMSYTTTFLASVARNAPDVFVHVHIINPNQRCRRALAAFDDVFGRHRLSATFETVDLSGVAEGYAPVYYSSVRFARLYQIAERRPAHYLSVDADCLVRGPLMPLTRTAGDIALLRRFGRAPHASVAAGGLFTRPTRGARLFLRDVAAAILSVLKAGEAQWFLDQIVISKFVERACRSGTLTVAQLNASYIDWSFRHDSLIWTGKGDRKTLNDRYVLEFSVYAADADLDRPADCMTSDREASPHGLTPA